MNLKNLKKLYAYRASAERAISRLKLHLSLENHKVRGLRNILAYALLCITAIKHGKSDKIRAAATLR